MANNGILGLMFANNADPGSVQQALQEFESSTEKLSASTSNLTQKMLLESEAMEKSRQVHLRAAKAVVDHETSLGALAGRIPTLSAPLKAELIPSLAEVDSSVASTTRRLEEELAPSFQRTGEVAGAYGQSIENSFLRATAASQ